MRKSTYPRLTTPALAVAAVCLGASAEAQQGSTFDWTGYYGGFEIGAAAGSNNWAERSVPVQNTPGDFSGGSVGLTLGMNRPAGNLIWGIEFDAAKLDVDAVSTTGGGFSCPVEGCTTSVDSLVTLRGRLGFPQGNNLPYLTAGAAAGSVEGTTDTFGVHGSDTLTGFSLGAGIERAFSPRISGKLEVLYTDLGRLELPTACGFQCYTDVSFTTLRLGINYHF